MGPQLRLPLCRRSFGADRAAIHMRLPQLTEIKEEEILNELTLFQTNNLMHMYVNRGSMADACRVFASMPRHDVVSWNIIILGHAKHDEGARALELYERMHQEGMQPSERTFVAALKACSSLATLDEGRQVDVKYVKMGCLAKGRAIHSQVAKRAFESDVFVGTTLVHMYAKCGSMEDAQRVFDGQPNPNVVTWTTMILGYAELEGSALALELYTQMHNKGVQPNDRTFVGALKACGSLAALEEGKQVDGKWMKTGCLVKGRALHFQVVKGGFESDVFVENTLVNMYVKCGSMEDANCVFEALAYPNMVSWNAMILGYAQQEEGAQALELYARMHQKGVDTCDRTFVFALKACSSLVALEEGKQADEKSAKKGCLEKGRAIHSQAIKGGFDSDVYVGTTLVDMYTKCLNLEDAQCVFDELPFCDVASWNAMILGYAQQEEGARALESYARMHREGVQPCERTFVAVLKACSNLAAPEEGKQVDGKVEKTGCLKKGRAIHSHIVKIGFESEVFVGNILVDMYAKCGILEDARRVFDALPHRDVVSWNAMILGYAQQEEGAKALELYTQMHEEGVLLCERTYVGALKACSTMQKACSSLAGLEDEKEVDEKFEKKGCPEKGRVIHSEVVKSGLELNVFIGNTLVDMYAKCGSLEDARCVFDEFAHRDVVSWNAMIQGYATENENQEAFRLFAMMQEQGLIPNCLTFVAILKACGNTAALKTTKELHSQISRVGFATSAIVAVTLIDVYGRCGSMVDAQLLFDALPTKDVVPWNALVAGYARQGRSEIVFHLFKRMRQDGIQPDELTFLSVLTVCSHVGLVDKGQKYFHSMIKQYHITPALGHCACMVDLLGRAGQLDQAVAMVEKMPFQPNAVVWLTILGACRKWKNVEVGKHAFEHVVILDDKIPAAYVLMANIYADAHMHDEYDRIQVMRKNAQAWKKPGKSWWTDLSGRVHGFIVGDRSHPQTKDISAKLKDLSFSLKEEGYSSHLEGVLQGTYNDEKEEILCGHSENLAIACALINTPEGTPIRIVKDMRVCGDCHKVTALISMIERRNIICRDSNRIHDYKEGKCSCGDYW